MINDLALFFGLGCLLVLLFAIFERYRYMTGNEMITEELIGLLEKVYRWTLKILMKQIYGLINYQRTSF